MPVYFKYVVVLWYTKRHVHVFVSLSVQQSVEALIENWSVKWMASWNKVLITIECYSTTWGCPCLRLSCEYNLETRWLLICTTLMLFQIMSVVNGNIFNSTTNTKPVKPNTK